MPTQPDQFGFLPSVTRVYVDGKLCGTGFYIGDRLVMTCAHVIGPSDDPPDVSLNLQFHGSQEKLSAILLPQYWRSSNAEDVAVLQLEKPSVDISPLQLGSSEDSAGHECRTFGYPDGHDDGLHGTAVVKGSLEEEGVLQIESTEVTVGFSGAPFYDTQTYAAIGMVTAIAKKDKYHRLHETGFVTPSETLAGICDRVVFRSRDAEEDFQRVIERLTNGAADSVGRSQPAMDFIVSQLPELEGFQGNPTLAKKIAERLVEIELTRVLDILVFGCSQFIDRADDDSVAAVTSLKRLAAHILPCVFSQDEVRAIRTAIDARVPFVAVPAKTETAIEIMMAGVDGREARLDSSAGDRSGERPQIQHPPEEGLSSERFQEEFLHGLQQALRIAAPWEDKPAKRINEAMAIHRRGYRRMRYYYVYQTVGDAAKDDERDKVIQELKGRFPELVFVKRCQPHDDSPEFELVYQLREMFEMASLDQ